MTCQATYNKTCAISLCVLPSACMHAKIAIGLVLITLIAGLGGGYELGYIIYQPQNQILQEEIDNLNDKIEAVNSTLANTMSSVISLQDEFDVLDSELQVRIEGLNDSLTDLQTHMKLDQPDFVLLDALPEEQLSKVRVIVWNVGGEDAHDVLISYNLTAIGDDSIKLVGDTTVPVLKAGEIGRIQVPWTVTRQTSGADVILHIEVSISCAEGVTKQDVIEHPRLMFP